MNKPQFVCSYRGESSHRYKGRQYACRTFACPGSGQTATSEDGHYNGDYYRTGILPTVGTIRNEYGDYHAFPPEEVCALFPEYVPARWNADFTVLEYLGEKPATMELHGSVWAVSLALECYPELRTGGAA